MKKKVKVNFEEALDKTGFGKYNYLMLLLCGSLVTSMVFEGLSMSYLVPASACELGTSLSQQGLMAGMPLIGVIATSHIWGYLADTRGRRPILAISLLLAFGVALLAAFSPNWICLCVLKVISCSSVSGTYALSITLLSESTPELKRGSMVILTTGLFMMANGIMAVLAIPILPLTFSYYIPLLNINFNSWRLLALIYTIPCILGSIGIYMTWESPKYLISAGRELEALDVLKRIHRLNNGVLGEPYQIDAIILDEMNAGTNKNTTLWQSILSQTVPLLKPPLLKNTLVLSCLFVVIYLCTNPYFAWLPTVADRFMRSVQTGERGLTFCEMLRSGLNSTKTDEESQCVLNPFAMTMVLGISLVFALSNTILGSVINCFGKKRLLIWIQVLAGISGICVNFSTNWFLSVVLFVVLIMSNLNFGVATTFTVDIYPTYLRAMAVCLTLMVGRASAVVGINILNKMLVTNCELSFYIFGALTIVGTMPALLLPADKKIR